MNWELYEVWAEDDAGQEELIETTNSRKQAFEIAQLFEPLHIGFSCRQIGLGLGAVAAFFIHLLLRHCVFGTQRDPTGFGAFGQLQTGRGLLPGGQGL